MAREPAPATAAIDEVGWRYSNYDTPFWARPNSRAGRWHSAREAAVQYVSLSPDGAWAELVRAEDLRSEDDAALVRMPLWVIRLNQARLADYRTFEKAEAAGFAPDALVDDDWGRCQREGRRLRESGYAGVVAPSAALPGAVNVTVFGARILWGWESAPAFAAAVPATVAAVGAPPAGLVERVRFAGDPHAGHAEYARAARRARRRPRRGT